MSTGDKLLPRAAVLEIVGTSTPTLYRWIAQGIFPRAVRLGPHSVRWSKNEITDWVEAHKQGLEA